MSHEQDGELLTNNHSILIVTFDILISRLVLQEIFITRNW
jgi:hypothetical protein